ncbi:MAG: DUF3159 domain-containing protein [Candidatus Nanopelagicales bacterium]
MGPEPTASPADPGAGPGAEQLASAEALGLDRAMLDKAIGGWRGMIDSGVPATVFVLAYLITGQDLQPALVAALASGGLIALLRIMRREPLQQVLAGFLGVAISAVVATRTGRAEDYFLIGLLTNVAYLAAYTASILARWPAMGVVVESLRGESLSAWRANPQLYRAYATASWVWVVMFALRLVIQLPMYFAGAVGMLGVAKLALGWPLFLLTAFLSYRIIGPVLAAQKARAEAQGDGAGLVVAPVIEADPA